MFKYNRLSGLFIMGLLSLKCISQIDSTAKLELRMDDEKMPFNLNLIKTSDTIIQSFVSLYPETYFKSHNTLFKQNELFDNAIQYVSDSCYFVLRKNKLIYAEIKSKEFEIVKGIKIGSSVKELFKYLNIELSEPPELVIWILDKTGTNRLIIRFNSNYITSCTFRG